MLVIDSCTSCVFSFSILFTVHILHNLICFTDYLTMYQKSDLWR